VRPDPWYLSQARLASGTTWSHKRIFETAAALVHTPESKDEQPATEAAFLSWRPKASSATSFIAVPGHHRRNPLSGLSAVSELPSRQIGDLGVKRSAEGIKDTKKWMAALINDSFAPLGSGRRGLTSPSRERRPRCCSQSSRRASARRARSQCRPRVAKAVYGRFRRALAFHGTP
jgi:hypothetical protein